MRLQNLMFAALAAGLAAASAQAATDPASWVRRILAEMDEIQEGNGYRAEGEPRPGSLATGGEARLEFALAGGPAYRIVLVCEAACAAGEDELLDSAGLRVAGPGVLVEMPKLDSAPAATGKYVLKVAMTDCASTSCAWSARLYARR
jgi:hypothetical protein